jgi:ribosomal protein S27E
MGNRAPSHGQRTDAVSTASIEPEPCSIAASRSTLILGSPNAARATTTTGRCHSTWSGSFAALECGVLAHGFTRARCGDCGHDVVQGSHVDVRAIFVQRATDRPVQFEITERTRDAVAARIVAPRPARAFACAVCGRRRTARPSHGGVAITLASASRSSVADSTPRRRFHARRLATARAPAI